MKRCNWAVLEEVGPLGAPCLGRGWGVRLWAADYNAPRVTWDGGLWDGVMGEAVLAGGLGRRDSVTFTVENGLLDGR